MASTNYGLIKNSLPAERQSGLRFLETFMNASEVSLNGGSISGTPTISNGKINSPLATDLVNYGKLFSTGTIQTIMFKIKINTLASFKPLIGLASSNITPKFCATTGNKLILYFGGSNYLYSTDNSITLGKEHNITLVLDGDTRTGNNKIIIDGIDVSGSSVVSQDPQPISDFFISGVCGAGGYIKDVRVFKGEVSAGDIEAYNNNTIVNYDKDAELILPMRLAQHDPSGLSNTEEIVDGDMEDAGTTAWLIANGAVLSKEDDAGTQVLKMMRAAGGSQYPYTYQEVLATLTNYIISGRYKIVNPTSGVNFRVGTTTQQIELGSSTTWKSFSEPLTTTNVVPAFFHLHTVTSDATYVLIDDISIKEAKPRTLDVSGNDNHATFGDGTTTSTFPTKLVERHGYDFDGSAQYLKGDTLTNLSGSSTMSLMIMCNFSHDYSNPSIYDIFIAGTDTWAADEPWALFVNGDNLRFEIKQDAASNSPKIIKGQKTTYGVVFNAGVVDYYLNGELYGTDTISETVIGNKDSGLYIGGGAPGRFVGMKGYEFYINKKALSPIQIKDLHNNMMQRYNLK